jgi:hypothetical protein
MFVKLRPLFAACALVSSACNPSPSAPDASSVESIDLGLQMEGLSRKVFAPALSICLSGNVATRATWRAWAEESLHAWLEAVAQVSRRPVVSQLNFVEGSACAAADLQINVNATMMRAYCRVGARPHIEVSDSDTRSGAVLAHELGHAFGLGDTYNEGGVDAMGRRRPCKDGQPEQALMCDTQFMTPQADDIKGIQGIFARLFPDQLKASEGAGADESSAQGGAGSVEPPPPADPKDDPIHQEQEQRDESTGSGEAGETLKPEAADCHCGLDTTGTYCTLQQDGRSLAWSALLPSDTCEVSFCQRLFASSIASYCQAVK